MGALRTVLFAVALAGVVLLPERPAGAQVFYTVNGVPASPAVTMYMARNGLPPGAYWLNQLGYWGVAGNPMPMGNIYAGRAAPAPRPGLSQRGLLYSPGEILNR